MCSTLNQTLNGNFELRHWMQITVVTSETNTTMCPASRLSPWACDIATDGISHLNFIENFLKVRKACRRILNLDAVQRSGVCLSVLNLGTGAPSAEGRHYWVTRVIWCCPLEILRYLNDESYVMIEKTRSIDSVPVALSLARASNNPRLGDTRQSYLMR